ncbi:tRNA pseudouridine(55) synthase TruB [bacterium]|nr:tRNA pseudouridine(55) synthase TruB [bacterium]|tara:strand:+ start:6362 stop:7039 length:678 start_codon:yes stop_codon:yes gene_type:complete
MERPELLLIDKPTGITSFDVIRELRKRTGIKKFGHAGTLDPAATGLMLIGVEQGTKKLTEYIKLDKEYVAEVALGESRTTGDLEGEIVEEAATVTVSEEEVQAALADMTGSLRLPVSAYSAIKKDGVPMYKRARAAEKAGETVEDVPVRDMVVHEAELLGMYHKVVQGTERAVVKIRFTVGSGTYIRSLGEELGRRLGYPATLASLRRTKVGEFRVEDAHQLEDF